jgi:hypothetical protein
MDCIENTSSVAVQVLFSNGTMYSTVTSTTISMDCAENILSAVLYRPLPSKGQLLWFNNSGFEQHETVPFQGTSNMKSKQD